MVSKTNEQALASAIEKFLTGTCLEAREEIKDGDVPFSPDDKNSHGYQMGYPQDFIAKYAIDEKFFWQFLENTQNEELKKLKKSGAHGGGEEEDPLDEIIRTFNERWFQGWSATPEDLVSRLLPQPHWLGEFCCFLSNSHPVVASR